MKYANAIKMLMVQQQQWKYFFGCSISSTWASLNLGIGPNDCYKKDDVKILPSVSDNPQYQVRM